jgi:hypothetical protein
MPALGAYANVLNTALIVLRDKGFRVWTDQAQDNWYGEREGWDFVADDPIQLLGLVAIYEQRKPQGYSEYWWRLEEPWLIEQVPSQPPEYVPVWKRGA